MKKTILALTLALGAVPAAAFAQTADNSFVTANNTAIADYCQEISSMSPMEVHEHRPTLAQNVASGIYLNSLKVSDCQRAGLL